MVGECRSRSTIAGRRMFLYNTVCEILLYEYEGDAGWLLEQAEELAAGVQKMLNIYDENSELSRLNRSYIPRVPYPLSKELFELLRSVNGFSALCDGAFDMTVGSLIRLWNFMSEYPVIPKPGRLREVMAVTGYKNLMFHENTNSLEIPIPGMTIDGGGFGKGYAVGLVTDFLKNHGVTSAVINFGGNLFLIGAYPRGNENRERWRIGVQSPWCHRGTSLGTLFLSDTGVATSAGYDRYFKSEGRVYHHIINPATGYPVETEVQSVSIVSDVPVITDLMSTAFFVLGLKRGEEIAKKLRKQMVLEYVVVTTDGLVCSETMQGMFVQI